jgi:hypothetical protein
MQVLFHDLVAADPHEGIPGSMLPNHVRPFSIALVLLDHGAADSIRIGGGDIADGAAARRTSR